MKKYLVFIMVCFPAFVAAIDHGSIMSVGLPLYPVRDGATPGSAVTGVTFDFKMVTIGTKTWVWTKLNGKSIAGNQWSSRFRLWYPDRQESNLLNRIDDTQETYGITGIPDINPYAPSDPDIKITFLQEGNNAFYETADIAYNYTRPNPADASDQIPPVLTSSVVSQMGQQLRLSLSATDNSKHFFYYIEDAANNFIEVSFFHETVLNLEPDKNYQLLIYAVDFSGNYSSPTVCSFTDLPVVESNAVSVYPNPSGNALYIKGIDSPVAIRILDMAGRTVLSRILSEEKIDISGFSQGVYFLKMKNETVKFIKK
jgi:hypothetical protein